MGFGRRIRVFVAVTQVPFAVALHTLIDGAFPSPAAWPLAGAVAAGAAWAGRGRVALAAWDRPITLTRRVLVEEPWYVHLFASTLALAACTLASIAAASAWLVTGSAFAMGPVALAAYAVGLALAVWAVLVRPRLTRVRHRVVALPDLPLAWDGYRIVQLSDLHLGSLCPPERGQRWVATANALGGDMVALTGDYVTTGVRFHGAIAGVLGALEAPDGVFAVMGNHDYFGDGEPLLTLLAERGVRVLRNEHAVVRRGAHTLTVAGTDDTYTRRADVTATLRGCAGAHPLIVLAHDPRLFPSLADGGADLVLSGHTHWGQLALPPLATKLNLARLVHRFHAGLYRHGPATLHVHPGLGTTGPPARLGVPPEITVLTLRARQKRNRPSTG